ncbi:hypothetical protein BV22DRAFT_1134674 [Leucogyrophana mollusca]|uniref:Uncharacterized protein n=1 Tax=Leucogyrophana mollusca TaxID=85980 RepID=A0ACB8AXS9_9AGAM|nr:hypothetical protein BV22DRAFT_1134674 [Leucogyrophana mollusca]
MHLFTLINVSALKVTRTEAQQTAQGAAYRVQEEGKEEGKDAEKDAAEVDDHAAVLDPYQRQRRSCRTQVGKLSVVASLPPAETSLPPAEASAVDAKAGADAKPGEGPLDAKLRENDGAFRRFGAHPTLTNRADTQILDRLRTPFEARQAK